MHPFLSRTRASMMFWPTTKWRPSNGFRASTSTVLHGIWRNSALLGFPFTMVAFGEKRFFGLAAFIVLVVFVFVDPVADVFRAGDFAAFVFSFFFFIRVTRSRSIAPTATAITNLYTARHQPESSVQ